MMRVLSLILASAAVCSCSADPPNNNVLNANENLTTADLTADDGVVINQMKAAADRHNYAEKDGSTYEYISAVSEEDRKNGKAAGDVSLFAFRGMFNGSYRISSVDDAGRTQWYYECPKACVVIKRYANGRIDGRIGYNPESVIGSAFEDAFSGRLEVSKEPSQQVAKTAHESVQPIYSAPGNISDSTDEPRQLEDGPSPDQKILIGRTGFGIERARRT